MSAGLVDVEAAATVAFFVEGVPRPQGRKSAITRHGRTVVVESGRALLKPWREAIAGAAARALDAPFAGPVRVELAFSMPRPLDHYLGRDRSRPLREGAPSWHAHRPDIDKLSRAVLDGLTGPALVDDGQVVGLEVLKLYGETPGVTIGLRPAKELG